MPILYNETLYNSKGIRKSAEQYLKVLPRNVTHLLSIGNSGCAIASAMLTLSRRKLRHTCYRKARDNMSHSSFSGGTILFCDICAIVDDFIISYHSISILFKRVLEYQPDRIDRIKYIIVDHAGDTPLKQALPNVDNIKLIEVWQE